MMALIWNGIFSEYIKPLLGLAVITSIVSAFWKIWTERQLAALSHGFSKEIETLRSELEKEKETVLHVFKSKYDLEIKIFQEIWSKVFELKSSTLSMNPDVDTYPFGETGEEKKARYISRHQWFDKTFNACLLEVDKNQPFLPKEIYAELDSFTTHCFREGNRFRLIIEHMSHDDKVQQQLSLKRDENHENLKSAYAKAAKLIFERTNKYKVIDE